MQHPSPPGKEPGSALGTRADRHSHRAEGKGGLCHIKKRVKVQLGHCVKQICESSMSSEPGVLLVITRYCNTYLETDTRITALHSNISVAAEDCQKAAMKILP